MQPQPVAKMPAPAHGRRTVGRTEGRSGRGRGRGTGSKAGLLLCAGALAWAAATPARSAPSAIDTADPTWQAPAGTVASPSALRLGLSDRTHLMLGPQPWQTVGVSPDQLAVAPPRPSLGIGLKSAQNGVQEMRSLITMQLSNDSTLHFRPRSGGLALSYRANF